MADIGTKRIILIGFRGAGKSTVGKLLAEKLMWEYISTDNEIEKRQNLPIHQIVETKGWDYFRKLESKVAIAIGDHQHVVVDTGGGVVENEEIMRKLIVTSMTVWIDANMESIYGRLQEAKNRPLLNRDNLAEDIKINYRRRVPLYQKYSRFRFNTSTEAAEKICSKIISEMR